MIEGKKLENFIKEVSSIKNIEEILDAMKDYSKLKEERDQLEQECIEWDDRYRQTIANVGIMVKHLDDLSKIAGGFNNKTQAMNVVYMCCEALRVKHPDAVDGVGAAFFNSKQIDGIRDLMLDSFKILRKNGEQNP